MILKAIELGRGIFDGSNSPLLASRDNIETRRKSNSFITMTHPDDLIMSNFSRGEKSGLILDMNLHTAIFLRVPDSDFTAETVNKKLKTITNAENRNGIRLSPLDEAVREGRGVRSVNGVGTTGENDDGGV